MPFGKVIIFANVMSWSSWMCNIIYNVIFDDIGEYVDIGVYVEYVDVGEWGAVCYIMSICKCHF